MAIFQDDSVKIYQAQIVKECLGGSMKNHFHTWITRSWPKVDASLDGNNITTFISIKRCVNFWL